MDTMDHPRLIHDYLDAELPADHQAELFAELAAREDLRSELQAQLRLHLAVRKDQGATAVPVDATHGIFAELGLPSPIITTSPTPAIHHDPATSTRTIAFLILLALAVLSTGTLMLNRDDASYQPTIMRPLANIGGVPSMVTAEPPAGSIPPMRGATGPVGPARGQFAADAPMEAAPDDPISATTATPLAYDESVRLDAPGPNDELPMSALPVPPAVMSSTSTDLRFETSLRSMAMRATNPDPSLVAGASTMLPFAAGIHYHLGAGHTVGIDLGYESVPQVFTRVENGQTVEYRQDPNVFWIGGTYRYHARSLSIGGIATPFAGATAAYTQLGPMARAMAGFTITPETRLSILVGLEGTVLAYPVQSQFFTTRSLQLTYGISYRF